MTTARNNQAFFPALAYLYCRVGIADLTTVGTSQVINIGDALPADVLVLGASVQVVEMAVGASLTNLVIDVGDSDDDDCHVAALELFASRTVGDRLEKPGARVAGGDDASQLIATFTSTGANLSVLTAGQFDVVVVYQALPAIAAD